MAQVLKHIGKRVMAIALQEVRPPRCGYMVGIYEERLDAQSCCAIAVRNAVLKRKKLNIERATRHRIEIGLDDGERETRVACAYTPPREARPTAMRKRR